jgi:hypothetical protein
MNFVGDNLHEQRPIHADASEYYGGTEYHSHARTYSMVWASRINSFVLR